MIRANRKRSIAFSSEVGPVRVKKTRQNKKPKPGSDSITGFGPAWVAESARAEAHAGAEEFLRVDRFAVDTGFIVQMRAGRTAG